MTKILSTLALLFGVAACAVAASAGKQAIPEPARAELDAFKLRDKLARKVNLDRGLEPQTPLKDALEFLGDRYDLTLIINTAAFKTIGMEKVEDSAVALPKLVGIKLETVLQMLLSQVASTDGVKATYRILPDHIEITTELDTCPEAWQGKHRGKRAIPSVSADFDRLPLDRCLDRLAALTGINVVLDKSRAREAGSKSITTRFNNVPVDTAVLLLTNMAGLEPVALDNVLYVTTRENVATLRAARPISPKPKTK